MIDALRSYMLGMTHTTKKDDIVKSLENIMIGINNEVIPALDSVIASENTIFEKDAALSNMRRGLTVKTKDNKDVFVKIKSFFSEVIKEEKNLSKLVEKELPTYITDKTVTAKDIAILKTITDLGGASFFILDFIYLILLDGKETNFPKIKLTEIKKHAPGFVNTVNSYQGKLSGIVKDLAKVADVSIADTTVNASMIDKLLSSKGKLIKLPTSGFINNPIYHIRMWLVDREINKYEALKDKKKLIELKLLDLKLSAQNEDNDKLKGQIEYYEEKLSKIEYDITQIEED